jgi:DNA gyrase subunit A
MMITDGGIVIRTPANEISTYSRSASGVIVMRLGDDHSIANFTKVPHEDESEEDVEAEEIISEGGEN